MHIKRKTEKEQQCSIVLQANASRESMLHPISKNMRLIHTFYIEGPISSVKKHSNYMTPDTMVGYCLIESSFKQEDCRILKSIEEVMTHLK